MKNGHPTLNKHSDKSISALLTLLQDEDDKVASLAMEQFLNSGLAEETVAQFQEASEPQLRQRIHQLSGILARRRARREFLDAVAANRLSGWEGLIQINVIYDPQTDRGWIADAMREIVNAAGRGATAARVAAVMRDKEFMVPDEDTLDVDLYLLDAVLDWNKVYGPRGFTQYQCVVPRAAGAPAVREFMDLLTQLGGASPLCVIKDCGPQGHGMLSFPLEGTSIAVDMAVSAATPRIVDRLNEFVIAAGGRIYLTKDRFTRPEHFAAMEPRLDAFLAVREKFDPQRRLRSAQSVRLFGDPV